MISDLPFDPRQFPTSVAPGRSLLYRRFEPELGLTAATALDVDMSGLCAVAQHDEERVGAYPEERRHRRDHAGSHLLADQLGLVNGAAVILAPQGR